VLLLANWAVCVLLLFGKAVQRVFLGPLRESEHAKLQERLLNFALFKVMFIAAMLEHSVGSVAVWLLWFVGCSLLKTFSLLGRERVDYLVGLFHGGGAAELGHRRPLALLGLVLAADAAIVGAALWRCSSLAFALLLCYECVCIAIDCCHGFAKAFFSRSPDTLSHSNYVIELSSDCVFLLASLLHYLHILFLLGVSFTLIDVILLLNMRSVVLSLFRRYSSYRLFLAMEGELRDRYPTVDDVPPDQVCAICREPMESAKRLPCDHLYHLSCIRSWLEQNQHNCPLCRYDLRKSVPDNRESLKCLFPHF
jgi:autocrine motility factor receptor